MLAPPRGEGSRAPGPSEQREALRCCAEVTSRAGSNFYLSFLPLPRPRREGMFCVYAFCRRVDDIVDEPATGSDPRAELAAWRDRLRAIDDGVLPAGDDPIAVGLAVTHARFRLPIQDLLAVVDGVEMDLDRARPRTWDDLALYCERVAGRVGCACLPVFGASAESRPYALALGHAFQLTNILRDVPRDAAEGRVYLPAEEMERHGVTEADLLAGSPSEPVRHVMRLVRDRAQDLFRQSERLVVPEDRPNVYPAQIMAAIYGRLLETLAASEHDAWAARPKLPARTKALLALGVYVRDRILRLS